MPALSSMLCDFRDKVVLITGANNPVGIGAALARAFAEARAKVAISYLRLEPSSAVPTDGPGQAYFEQQRGKTADAVVNEIAEKGGLVAAWEADLSLPDTPRLLCDWAEREVGPVDILINNAAHYEAANDTILAITSSAIDRTFQVNVRAAALLMREFALRYRQRNATSGRIINLSTDAAQSFAGQISYGASKAAIEALTRSIARELGPLGITVNAVAPGPVQTGYIAAEDERCLTGTIPMRRIGTPDDIVRAVMFLASEEASWITGQVLRVDGGHTS